MIGQEGAKLTRIFSSMSWLNSADLYTALRILAVPVLYVLAWVHAFSLFRVIFPLAVASDALDGWLARRARTATSRGRYLDSRAANCCAAPGDNAGGWGHHDDLPDVGAVGLSPGGGEVRRARPIGVRRCGGVACSAAVAGQPSRTDVMMFKRCKIRIKA